MACPSCGRDVLWVRHEESGQIPVDPEPQTRYEVVEVDPSGAFANVKTVEVYVSHFETCPKTPKGRELETLEKMRENL